MENTVSYRKLLHMSLDVVVPFRSDTILPVQAQKWLEACKKKKDSYICVAKTKVLINWAVTTQLICAFVYA